MNTKSMILALNSFILFNSVSHGFSIASVRKKLVETCASIGKKSVAFVSIIALILLSTLSMRGGAFGSAKVKSTWRAGRRSSGWAQKLRHDSGPGSQHFHTEVVGLPSGPC